MPNIIFPGLFPIVDPNLACDVYDSANYTLSEALAMHWKVKKWEISITASWGTGLFGTGTVTLNRESPELGLTIDSVYKLVCHGFQFQTGTVDDEGNLYDIVAAFYPGSGPEVGMNGFEFFNFRFPNDGLAGGQIFPIDISFSGFNKQVDGVIYNEEAISCSGTINATEYFAY